MSKLPFPRGRVVVLAVLALIAVAFAIAMIYALVLPSVISLP